MYPQSMTSKCKVIAIANHKGATGKTTTTVNLGIGLEGVVKMAARVVREMMGL